MRRKRESTPFAKIVSFIGGLIGLAIFVAWSYARYACDGYSVYHSSGGSWCGPFRVLYDIGKWLQS